MPTGNTSLLGLALPVQGELSGTWGDVVNQSITELVDSAVAGTTTLSADSDVTLTTTVLAANQARQAIIRWTASNGATTRNITAPAQSKPYIVINAGTGSIVLRGAGPTTGITIAAGERCLAAWSGSDFVKVATTAAGAAGGSNTQVQFNSSGNLAGSANMTFDGTRLTVADLADSGLTSGRVTYAGSGGALVDSANLTFSGTTLTSPLVKVGTGAATNSGRLMVNTPNGTAAGIQLFQDSQESWTMENIASGTALRWLASSTELMRLTNAGVVTITGNEIINANTSTTALRITQTGTGNALVVEDDANPDATPFVVDPTGVVISGNTTAFQQGTTKPYIQIQGTDNSTSGFGIARFSNDSDRTRIVLAKSRGSLGNQVVVQSGDVISNINSFGSDGTNFVQATSISSEVDGTPGTNDMPGRLVFSTTADGSSSPTERMRIDNAGVVTVAGNEIINANTSTDALRITQTGTGNALVVEDSANPDSTPFVVDAAGNVGVGVVTSFANNKFSVAGSGSDASSWFLRYSADVSQYEARFLKSRSTNPYAYAIVQSGDGLGILSFGGDDGSAYRIAASIRAEVDGTPGTNDMPGRLVLSTTPDGSNSPVERLRIDNAGNVGIGGTASSSIRLQVTDSASNACQIRALESISGVDTRINSVGGIGLAGIIGTYSNHPVVFYTNSAERVRITTAGFFGLGVTSPQAMFDLAGDYKEGVVTANTGTSYTINTATGTVQILTLTGNCTFTFPTAVAGESFTLLLRQDGTGSRTVTWPAAVRWPGGTAPTITATASRQDKYVFTADGTNWYGSNAGQNYTV